MTGNDITPFRLRPYDLITAIALLTRVPLPARAFRIDQARPAAHAAWAYPLVGLIVSLGSIVVGWAAMLLGLPPSIAAFFALLAGILCTGAMHEDGLADCADGFWGGWTTDRRLEIMKDSQIGTYGVIALFVGLGLRWVALTALLSSQMFLLALICAGVISRAAMVLVMYALPSARHSGLSGKTGRPPQSAALVAAGIGVLATLFASAAVIPLLAAIALVTCSTGIIARVKIGGQTGDVLGATQQVVEITVLLACVAALP